MKFVLVRTVAYFFDFLSFMILIRSFLSWFSISRNNVFVSLVVQLTDPVLEPFKRLMDRLGLNKGMVDFSPVVSLLFLYYVIKPLLITLIYTFF